jgi:hypothetical protein
MRHEFGGLSGHYTLSLNAVRGGSSVGTWYQVGCELPGTRHLCYSYLLPR